MPKTLASNSITIKLSFDRDDAPYPMLFACRSLKRAHFIRWHLAWALDPTCRPCLVPFPEFANIQSQPPEKKPSDKLRIQISIAPGEPGYRELLELPSIGDSRSCFVKRHLHGSVTAQLTLNQPENVAPRPETQPILTPEAIAPSTQEDIHAQAEESVADAEIRESLGLSALLL